MDVNGDGDISGLDRVILAQSWLAEEGDEDYIPAADTVFAEFASADPAVDLDVF